MRCIRPCTGTGPPARIQCVGPDLSHPAPGSCAGDQFVKPSVRKGVLPSILAALIQVCTRLCEPHTMPTSLWSTGTSDQKMPLETDACGVRSAGALRDESAAEGGPGPGTPGGAGQPAEGAEGAPVPLHNLKNNDALMSCVEAPVPCAVSAAGRCGRSKALPWNAHQRP